MGMSMCSQCDVLAVGQLPALVEAEWQIGGVGHLFLVLQAPVIKREWFTRPNVPRGDEYGGVYFQLFENRHGMECYVLKPIVECDACDFVRHVLVVFVMFDEFLQRPELIAPLEKAYELRAKSPRRDVDGWSVSVWDFWGDAMVHQDAGSTRPGTTEYSIHHRAKSGYRRDDGGRHHLAKPRSGRDPTIVNRRLSLRVVCMNRIVFHGIVRHRGVCMLARWRTRNRGLTPSGSCIFIEIRATP